jgi:alpha-methylacyl-CoA racemase
MTSAFHGLGLWRDERGVNLLDGGMPNYRCYECADGQYVAVGALEAQFWTALCAGLGLDEAAIGSPYDEAARDQLTGTLAARFAERTRDEWAERFAATDACVAPVLSLAEARRHPHAIARGAYTDMAGVSMPAPAPRFSGSGTPD